MIRIWKYDFYDYWVLFFIPIIVLFGIYIWRAKQKKTTQLQYTGSKQSMLNLATVSLKKWQRIQLIAFTTALIFLTIALARPCYIAQINREALYDKEGIDIIIAMDISNSMLASDFYPNRLEVAKTMAIDFINNRASDRFGLVVYEGEALTACPLTLDHFLVQSQILNAAPGKMNPGTAIGVGLATAVARLNDSTSKSKVIILMTDGVNNQGETSPQLAQEMAVKAKAKVYTIGIGSNRGFIDINGQRLEVKIDEDLMTEISKATGGKYFRATDASSLQSIYAQINQMETTAHKDNSVHKSPPVHPLPFLLIAALSLIIALSIGQSKLKTLA
jgi:Ca-activated chloride channel family protein